MHERTYNVWAQTEVPCWEFVKWKHVMCRSVWGKSQAVASPFITEDESTFKGFSGEPFIISKGHLWEFFLRLNSRHFTLPCPSRPRLLLLHNYYYYITKLTMNIYCMNKSSLEGRVYISYRISVISSYNAKTKDIRKDKESSHPRESFLSSFVCSIIPQSNSKANFHWVLLLSMKSPTRNHPFPSNCAFIL
jgi:hypothetical protein